MDLLSSGPARTREWYAQVDITLEYEHLSAIVLVRDSTVLVATIDSRALQAAKCNRGLFGNELRLALRGALGECIHR